MLSKWDERYLQLATLVASWSEDPSTKAGAVIVDERNTVVSLGFNGIPRHVENEARWVDRSTKYEVVIHCELNALVFAGRQVGGATIYLHPFLPCSRCASILIQAGIRRVVAPILPPHLEGRWAANLDLSKTLFKEAGVEVAET